MRRSTRALERLIELAGTSGREKGPAPSPGARPPRLDYPSPLHGSASSNRRTCLQRLFSTFADGWPGAGLLLQRVLTSTILLYFGSSHLLETARLVPSLPYLTAAVAGVFLLLGLWTPVAGITIATVELWISLAWSGNSLTAIMLAGLGATAAMIGPGLWSIDARLYGRKHLQDPRH